MPRNPDRPTPRCPKCDAPMRRLSRQSADKHPVGVTDAAWCAAHGGTVLLRKTWEVAP